VEYEDDECSLAPNLENKIKLECDHCRKMFWAEAQVVYSTYFDCSLNEEEHEWEETSIEGFYQCKNCPEYEHLKEALKTS